MQPAATISVSKVAPFKPNGANYIDEDTTINNEQELWSISATSNRHGDEEIYARGSHIIWTYPLQDIQCPSYMEFTTDTMPKKLLWTKFDQCSMSCEHGGTEFPIVIEQNCLTVLGMDSGYTKVALPFSVSKVWPFRNGLVIERQSNDHYLPNLFSLSHPLDEVKPVISRHHGDWFYSSDKHVYITAGLAIDEQLLLRFDEIDRVHSLWLLRKCTDEDRHQATNMTLPTMNESQLGQGNHHQTLNTNTLLNQQNMSLAQISMLNNTLSRRSSILTTTILGGPPGSAVTNSSPNPGHLITNPRRLASMAVISRSPLSDSINRGTSRLPSAQLLSSTTTATPFSCSTLTLGNGGGTTHLSHFPTTALIDRMGTNGSFMATLNADCAAHSNSIPDPLCPEYCVEFIWSDTTYNSLAKDPEQCATKFFGVRDLSDHRWVAFLMPHVRQLRLILLEKTTLGTVNTGVNKVETINARDAVFVASLKFLVVLDLSRSILLYSGASKIAKVLLHEETGPLSSHSFLRYTPYQRVRTSSRPTSFHRTPLPLKFPSSPVSQSLTPTPNPQTFFCDESLNDLNPTAISNIQTPGGPGNFLSTTRYESLDDVRGRLFNLKLHNNRYYTVELPNICHTPLCLSALKAVCSCVPREVFNQFMAIFYSSNIDPIHEHSPTEWYTFVKTLLSLIGYDLRKCSYIKRLESKSASPTPPQTIKKTKIDVSDIDEDWPFMLNEIRRIEPNLFKLFRKDDVTLQLLDKTPDLSHDEHDDGLSNIPIIPTNVDCLSDDENDENAAREWPHNISSTSSTSLLIEQGDTSTGSVEHPSPAIISNIFPQQRHKAVSSTPTLTHIDGNDKQKQQRTNRYTTINSNDPLYTHAGQILCALHVIYEDLTLNHTKDCTQLLELLYLLACDFDLHEYRHYYLAENWRISKRVRKTHQLSPMASNMFMPRLFDQTPPSYLKWARLFLSKSDNGSQLSPFPYIASVTNRIVLCTKLLATYLYPGMSNVHLNYLCNIAANSNDGTSPSPMLFTSMMTNKNDMSSRHQQIIDAFLNDDLTSIEFDSLPLCVHAVLYEAISHVALHPKFDLPRKTYEFIGRQELSYHDPKLFDKNFHPGLISLRSLELIRVYGKDYHNDKTRLVESEVLKLRFPEDLRVQTIVECLQSSTPVMIDIAQRPNVTEQEVMENNERYLFSVAQRTMSLPFGRGALTLGTVYASPHDAFIIPELNLKGRVPSSTVIVNMTHIEVPQNITHWPLFHNGVAASLAINRHACDMGDNWIRSQILKNNDITNEQAGFLYGLGLIGHFKNLPKSLIYSLLQKANELTMMASLLGICVSNYKSMSLTLTSLLTIYIKSMLPQTLFEWEVPFGVQICGIMGLGLLYAGSGDRYISDILLAEIGKLPVSTGEKEMVILEREAYAFTSGIALGTVLFKKGLNSINSKEDFFTSALLSYIIGKERVYAFGSLRTHIQVHEYGSMNANITATGAMIAIGLTYFNTKNKDIAEWFTPNDIMRLIELVRPDLLLLRTVVYNLISWESITNTHEWIEKQIPTDLSKNAFHVKISVNTFDSESITQAYGYLVSGVCFSLALKYAGTWNEETANIIRGYFKRFQVYIDRPADYVESDPDSYAPDTMTLEFVLSTLVLSLAMVMAGSGDLPLLNLLRALQTRVGPDRAHVTYGSHVSVSMSLGLLLLGGGRYGLRNDDDAIPILLAAFYPHFPMSSNDNRFHLQIFRHLYVMVCESRLMITKDVSNQQVCSLNGRLWVNENNQIQMKNFHTPCFLPNFISIQKLEMNDSNYWPIIYEDDEQIQRLKQMLSRDGLFYVQKSSILSSLTLKKTSSSLVQLLSSNESSLRTWFHALQLYSGIQRIINEPINNRHVKEMHALISFYEKYTSIKKLPTSTDTDDVILRTQFTNILFKNISKMKVDLLVALKNQYDSRRFGLLLPIREWLPGLNEENLLSLLDTTSPAKLIRYAVNLGLNCELALYLLTGTA
ncbi:unnamed protein product [Rotaria socialis]|uniref:Anaphase-promoting complex subunit 1 n=1 Tax=Rotaria socialis TaxID=392032 RepID=A0A818C613_9BILA|nr:unnamed protein product [Rotaria socialis]CAF4456410.1 unnamed protein product [Rotaria socialis]